MSLKDIKLTEIQQDELKDRLDAWRIQEKKKIEEELTERYEQMEAQIKDENEQLVEEIKENMKKVYTKRFTKALKEMYNEIKAEVMVEALNSPEAKALDEVKTIVYPLINEATAKRHKDEFSALAQMYENTLEELELLKGSLKKSQLVGSLSPEVKKVVDKLLGEGNEQEIVEKFAEIKKALKEDASTKEEKDELNEDIEIEDENIIENEEDEIIIERKVEEEKVEEEKEEDNEFAKTLNEQLILAGLKKAR